MIIGLVPGAMKPYHAGHHFLVEQALAKCHKVKIYTTAKDREGISGKNMKKAWETLILPLLDIRVEVEFVMSPVGSVFSLMEQEEANPSGTTYRIYGGTEDAPRFNTEYVQNKFPLSGKRFVNVAEEDAGIFLRGVGKSPMAKGEWIRKTIFERDHKKFQSFLPRFLKPYAEEYLRLLLFRT